MNNMPSSEPYMSIMLKRIDEINEKLAGLSAALDSKVMSIMGPEPVTENHGHCQSQTLNCLRDVIEEKLDTAMRYLDKLGYLQGNLNKFV